MKIIQELAKNGEPTLAIQTTEKKQMRYIHSKYNPSREAKQWATHFYNEQTMCYVVFGIGLGYHIKALHEKIDDNVAIIAIEPRFFSDQLKNQGITVSELNNETGLHIATMHDLVKVRALLRDHFIYLSENSVQLVFLEIFSNFFKDELTQLKEIIVEMFQTKLLNYNTDRLTSITFMKNYLENLPFIVNGYPLNLFKDYFSGYPAVIVSSGPSLSINIDQLKAYQNHAIIISGGRSYQALVQHGISPHFLCSIDATDQNYQMYQSMDVLSSTVPLVAYAQTNAALLQKYKGDIIVFSDNNIIDHELIGRKLDALHTSGTVALTQLSLALYLGCRDIVFIGQDLALKDGEAYGEITKSSLGQGGYIKGKKTLFVEGNYTKQIETTTALNMFRYTIEELINAGKRDANFYNATQGGAYIRGTKRTKIDEFFEQVKTDRKYQNIEIEIKEILAENKPLEGADDIIDNIEEDIKRKCEKVQDYSEVALVIINKMKKQDDISPKQFRKIEKIRKKISNITDKIEILSNLMWIELDIITQRTKRLFQNEKDEILDLLENTYQAYRDSAETMIILIKENKEKREKNQK